MLEYYIVSLKRPGGVSIAGMEDYIQEAVQSRKDVLDPSDYIFDLDPESVNAKRLTDQRVRKILTDARVRKLLRKRSRNATA